MSDGRKRRALVVGYDYHGRYLADLISSEIPHWELSYFGNSYLDKFRALITLARFDAIICFGGPAPDGALAEEARRSNVPIIVIWAGTDVLLAGNDPGFLAVVKQEADRTNVAVSPWLVDELRQLNIAAEYVPVGSVAAPKRLTPLPGRFSVLSYLPEPRRAFYGEKAVYAIARALPRVTFLIVGAGTRNPVAPQNVAFLGNRDDMHRVMDSSSVLLRMPEHDGQSMMVLEALARGRHVVWTYDIPHVKKVSNVSEATAAIARLADEHERGTLQLNEAGAAYVRERHSRSGIAGAFARVLDKAVTEAKTQRHRRSHRVVISGFNLFTAQVARATRSANLDWEPIVPRARGRLERLMSLSKLISADVWYTIGTPIPNRSQYLAAAIMRKSRVMHWVGSDVTLLRTNPHLRRWARNPRIVHLAEVDWMIEELAEYNIRASLAPLPPQFRGPSEIYPLPERFTVLLYLPKHRGEFYGRREFERLMRAFASKPVRFMVVGGGEIYAPPEVDIVRLGWKTDLREVYEQVTVLLRFTQHDGLSLMALEALSYGRHLLWSQDFAYGTHVRSYEDCERELSRLLALHLAKELKPQEDAARYVSETYSESRCIARIASFWEASMKRERVALGAAQVSR